MTTITASLVKELRNRTNAGMMDCKKALTETDGDLEAAIDLMRASGAAKAAKKAGRVAAEGLVSIKINGDGKKAVILEVNSETDFVAKGSAFIEFVDMLTDLALQTEPDKINEFMNQSTESGESVEQSREGMVAKIGENITIRRVQTIKNSNGIIAGYAHGGRIAVLVKITGGSEGLAKDLAMHIAASKPECVKEEELPQSLLEREKTILIERAKESGKPNNIIEKMIVGRMKKFVGEATLYGQPFVKDPNTTVGELVKSNQASVSYFVRFEVGEGIEKKEDDFVAEVMAQAKG